MRRRRQRGALRGGYGGLLLGGVNAAVVGRMQLLWGGCGWVGRMQLLWGGCGWVGQMQLLWGDCICVCSRVGAVGWRG